METWWAKTLVGCALAAVLLPPVGALGSRFGLWGFELGLLLLAVGAVLAVVGIGGGIAGIVVAKGRDLSADLWGCSGALIGFFAVIVVLGMQMLKAGSAPPLHQVSTNVDEPPEFIDVRALRGEGDNPLEYDAEELGPMLQEHYPALQPLILRATPEEAFAKVRSTLLGMGLEIVGEHPQQGLIEATDTTLWFGFKDDVAVRVAAYPQGSVVDVRSVSRVGVSDLGVNAKRAQEILRQLQGG